MQKWQMKVKTCSGLSDPCQHEGAGGDLQLASAGSSLSVGAYENMPPVLQGSFRFQYEVIRIVLLIFAKRFSISANNSCYNLIFRHFSKKDFDFHNTPLTFATTHKVNT